MKIIISKKWIKKVALYNPEDRKNLGSNLLDYDNYHSDVDDEQHKYLSQQEDVNTTDDNADVHSTVNSIDDIDTRFIRSVGYALFGSRGKAVLRPVDVNGAIAELEKIIRLNQEYINPLRDEDIRNIRILQSRLKKDLVDSQNWEIDQQGYNYIG